ncbi:MAG: DUF4270 domain-containing protein [Dysgonomonas sp.]
MKIKTLLTLAILFVTTIFIACNDDLNSIGSNIQPGGDDIFVGTDTVFLTARTVSFEDSVYARTVYGLLGEYLDPVVGKIKSDYLCEFYCPKDMAFADRTYSIDSIFLDTEFVYFTGDTVAPMGLSIYEVQNPLKAFFFTSIDPKKYTGENPELYGHTSFTIQDVPDTVISSTRYRTISTKLKTSLAEGFYNEWKTKPGTFESSNTLREFFKGVYVTTTFGSGTLINTNYTQIRIHYKNYIRNIANTADSTVYSTFKLPVTGEVIQMNHIENEIPNELFQHSDTKTYMKTPAGVYTELTIPLNDIISKAGKNRKINAANLKVKGYTEEEQKSGLSRPSAILLINKDSLANFFYNRKLHDAKTSFVISRNTSTNTYDFQNIASIVNHYTEYYKDQDKLPDLKYLMIPISFSYVQGSTSTISDIYNQMYPTSAILRTDKENLKMPIIFSEYYKK